MIISKKLPFKLASLYPEEIYLSQYSWTYSEGLLYFISQNV